MTLKFLMRGTHIYMYCIMCTECKKNIYVGQTGDKFYQRMLLNFSKIRTQKMEDPVAKPLVIYIHNIQWYYRS
jgi:hypothetical protein